MKIEIKNTEVQKGLLRKKTYYRVSLKYAVSDEEKRIVDIKHGEIGNLVVIDPREYSCDSIPLRVGHFQGEAEWDYDFSTPGDAGMFQAELKEKLGGLKSLLDQYQSKSQDDSFEL